MKWWGGEEENQGGFDCDFVLTQTQPDINLKQCLGSVQVLHNQVFPDFVPPPLRQHFQRVP